VQDAADVLRLQLPHARPPPFDRQKGSAGACGALKGDAMLLALAMLLLRCGVRGRSLAPVYLLSQPYALALTRCLGSSLPLYEVLQVCQGWLKALGQTTEGGCPCHATVSPAGPGMLYRLPDDWQTPLKHILLSDLIYE